MFIATLIAAESIAERDISEAVAQMTPLCVVADWSWIDEGRAADIHFAEDPDFASGVLHGYFSTSEYRSDVVIQPAAHRAKRLLVADMDSTMITVECIDELADYAGIKEQVAEVTERAMRGELDFAAALDARVALLEGLDESVIEQCLAERVTLMAGARALVRTMKARGGHAILVSGGFTRFAEPVAAEIGFDRAIANYLEIAHGKLTGTVRKPIVGSDTKEKTLLAALDELGIGAEQSMAVGDGANDLAMIRRAGLGVAYRAKPIVAGAAAARIDHGDLTALLYAQGIPSAEWVTA
ncbi:MAG TPA: phosphoserine phosphatase SerB [Sphingomonas sanguinis]|uniref:phosphoserine phosphatase SerB n=1 Tax=Sphingomonas sanguinis TaxID=33051 RepID=UPI002ABEEC68|nr:phosphoserine phosphatase SerB [Sphingomonas sanguinis]HJO65702.1 phosphoserine phosphatase SerB [Sphingomonas sanguinis]